MLYDLRFRTMAVSPGALFWALLLTYVCLTIAQHDPVVSNSGSSVTIDETDRGVVIFTILATDPDGDTLECTMTSGDTASFGIDNSTCQVYILSSAVVNADGGGTVLYTLGFQISDGENTTIASLTVNINQVNEVPAMATQTTTFTVQESDTIAATLHTFVITPLIDPEGDTLTYQCTIWPNTDSVYCDNNQIKTYALPNYTSTYYTIDATVSDGSATSASKQFTINVNNVWPDPPYFNNLPNTTSENEDTAVGTVLYTVEAWDPDNVTHGDNFSLAIESFSPDDNVTVMFLLDNMDLKLNAPFDAETVSTYTVNLRACDNDGCTYQSLTVNVIDVPEPPKVGWPPKGSIPENTPKGYVFQPDWNVTDDDGQTVFTYSLAPTADNNFFKISTTDGNLTYDSSALVDYESTTRTSRQFLLDVLISDGTGQTATATVTVNIEDENEFDPVIELEEYEAEIPEGSNNNILSFKTSDDDGGPVFGEVTTWRVGAPGDQYFKVIGGTLMTYKNVDLEALDDDDMVFYVYAVDGGGKQDSALVRLKITNVNEFGPTVPKLYKFRVNANAAIGTLAGIAEAIDSDLEDLVIYNQVENMTTPFFISYLDGQVVVNGILEPSTTYTFWAYAEDSGTPARTSVIFEIQISTYDGEGTIVDWVLDTTDYYTESDIAAFEAAVQKTCAPCTVEVVDQYPDSEGKTVLQVTIRDGNNSTENAQYWTKDKILKTYTTDGKKTPTDAAAALAPNGKVVSINEAYVTPPENWLVNTVEGNIVLALLCLLAFGLICTGIAVLLDKYWWMKRPAYRKYPEDRANLI